MAVEMQSDSCDGNCEVGESAEFSTLTEIAVLTKTAAVAQW
eukprot:COSAG06_NODE_6893_length_2727_cov_1.593227_3_plen_41_part_00